MAIKAFPIAKSVSSLENETLASRFATLENPEMGPRCLTWAKLGPIYHFWFRLIIILKTNAFYPENDVLERKCISECELSDDACAESCSQEYTESLKSCPCRENCPTGCPCPNYQCPTVTGASILTTTSSITTTTNTSTTSITTAVLNQASHEKLFLQRKFLKLYTKLLEKFPF